jgi:hypothetical protein
MATRVGHSPSGRAPLSVGFMGFHHSIQPVWNHVVRGLAHEFVLDVSEKTEDGHLKEIPQILFTSVFDRAGKKLQHQFRLFDYNGDPDEVPLYRDPRYDGCIKVHTSDECLRPPWHECDYAFTGDFTDDPRHLRFPVYVRDLRYLHEHPPVWDMRFPDLTFSKAPVKNWDEIFKHKTRFCNFVYSNPHCKERVEFARLLSKYKQVDCGGELLNNLGYRVREKLTFLESYKFTIAFENVSYPGYVTEKAFEAMVARSMPVYWGSPQLEQDFNPASMVVATGRKPADVVDEIVSLDGDDAAYVEKMKVPWFWGDRPNYYCEPDYFASFIGRILRSCGQEG